MSAVKLEGERLSMQEILGGSSMADYTVIECEGSLVVINGLTGLTPKQTSENKRDCQWLRPSVTAPPYILQPRLATQQKKAREKKLEQEEQEYQPELISLVEENAKILLSRNRAELEVPSLMTAQKETSDDEVSDTISQHEVRFE